MGDAYIAAKRLVRIGELFWIASMTKAVTATSVLMLVHDGEGQTRRFGFQVHPGL